MAQQLQASQHAAQQALTAQIRAEQKLNVAQQDAEHKLQQQSHELHQLIRTAEQSAQRESGEQLQVMQAEFEQNLAAAMSDADQQMQDAQADWRQQLHEAGCVSQQLQQQQQDDGPQRHMVAQLQTNMDAAQLRLQAEHEETLRELHAYQQEVEDSQKAHNKAADRHQIKVAELQSALEQQREEFVRQEHEALDRHMAGMAAKDTMVQQMWAELHDRKQDCQRYVENSPVYVHATDAHLCTKLDGYHSDCSESPFTSEGHPHDLLALSQLLQCALDSYAMLHKQSHLQQSSHCKVGSFVQQQHVCIS